MLNERARALRELGDRLGVSAQRQRRRLLGVSLWQFRFLADPRELRTLSRFLAIASANLPRIVRNFRALLRQIRIRRLLGARVRSRARKIIKLFPHQELPVFGLIAMRSGVSRIMTDLAAPVKPPLERGPPDPPTFQSRFAEIPSAYTAQKRAATEVAAP